MTTQQTQGNETTPKYKSVSLEAKEILELKKFIRRFPNRTLAATALGLNSRTTLANILRAGSGRSDSIAIIRNKIGVDATAA